MNVGVINLVHFDSEAIGKDPFPYCVFPKVESNCALCDKIVPALKSAVFSEDLIQYVLTKNI